MAQQYQVAGFTLRPPTEGNAEDVARLVVAYDTAAFGSADFSVEDLHIDWRQPGFVLETDAVVVPTSTGQIVGYAAVHDHGQHARLFGDGYVHPDYRDRGIGTALARWSERRARELVGAAPQGTQVTLDQGTAGTDAAAASLLSREGYTRVRSFWHMSIQMEGPPSVPTWPKGIIVRPFVPGEDEYAAYTTATEAFQDHWDHVAIPFEGWRASRIDREGFDPSLVFLARENDTVAGAIRCRMRGEGPSEKGWVDNLSVRRPWRGRGLGTALLVHAFGTFYGRGTRTVGLGVDAESLTGATRLYERTGMHIERHFDTYRKTLREGREPE
jgi:mycothiol synthase